MSGKRVRKAIFGSALAAALAAGAGYLWLNRPYRGFSAPSVTVEFPVGTTTREIFRSLARAGVVRNARLAEAEYRILGLGQPLLAGEYRFDGRESLEQVIRKIIAGDVVQHLVVVREGLTNQETFRLFIEQGIGTERGFERSSRRTDLLPFDLPPGSDLEGFLFPSTYRVTRSTPTRQIVERMVEDFRRHFTPGMAGQARVLGLTVSDAVTLASFVEKETSIDEERPRVAAVYLNRLRRGMRLQCDPTVIYALQKSGAWTGRLRPEDLQFDSPYNTYLHAGLTPGPICNPGGASLRAAVDPAATDDLYFVARGDGGHYFSRTYEEHLRMIQKSRSGEPPSRSRR
jgi:UPF0755 protein